MSDLTTTYNMVRIENIPICQTGIEYPLASGPKTFTESDLADAVEAATHDPAVKTPRLRLGWQAPEATLGHVDESQTWAGAGEPNFGNFINLRLSADKQQILADLETLDWLAEIMPIVYPARSIEGSTDVEIKETGKKYRLVINRVALLGVELPGVTTLDDLRDVLTDPEVTILAKKPGVVVRAQVDAEDVRRKFYEMVDDGEFPRWSWIRSVRLQPDEIIFMDEDDSQLYRVPFYVNDREVTLGESVAVYEQYVDEPKEDQEPVAAAKAVIASWSTAAASRKDMEEGVDRKKLREALGLPDDATDEQVFAKAAELRASASGDEGSEQIDDEVAETDEEPEADAEVTDDDSDDSDESDDTGEPNVTADGTVTLDRETYDSLVKGAKDGTKARQAQVKARRDKKVQSAVDEGKFPKSRYGHYRKLMEADEEGTTALLASLEPGVIPVHNQEVGGDTEALEASMSTGDGTVIRLPYPTDHLTPVERERIAQARAQEGR